MKLEEVQSEYNKSYDKGLWNHCIRSWFYLQRGLGMLNEFKYVVAGILGIYITLKLESVWWLAGLFVVAIPVLVAVGFLHTHKMAKALEWTSMMFSSYFARHNVDLQEKQVLFTGELKELLKEILAELKRVQPVDNHKKADWVYTRAMTKPPNEFHAAAGTSNHGMYGKTLPNLAIAGVKKVAGKVLTNVENKFKAMDAARDTRNAKLIKSQGHTPDTYAATLVPVKKKKK